MPLGGHERGHGEAEEMFFVGTRGAQLRPGARSSFRNRRAVQGARGEAVGAWMASGGSSLLGDFFLWRPMRNLSFFLVAGSQQMPQRHPSIMDPSRRQGSQAQEAYETRKQMAPDTKNRVRFVSGWFGAKGTAPGTHLASASHSCFGEPEPRKMLRCWMQTREPRGRTPRRCQTHTRSLIPGPGRRIRAP